MYRKPDGEYTGDVEEMAQAWMDLARPIEEATGWVLYGFNPTLSFHPPNLLWPTAHLPVEFARALTSALSEEVRGDNA